MAISPTSDPVAKPLSTSRNLPATVASANTPMPAGLHRLEALSKTTHSLLGLIACASHEHKLLQEAMACLTQLLPARFGAIGIVDESGELNEVVDAGRDEDKAVEISQWLRGTDLIELLSPENRTLRINNLGDHCRAAAEQPNPPLPQSLLAAAIAHQGLYLGQVYLCGQTHADTFTAEDEWVLATFANILALGILNRREQKRREQTEQSMRIAAIAFEQSSEGLLITDVDLNILTVNQALTTITGYEREEVLGRTPKLFSSGHHNKSFYAAMWQSITETGHWRGEIWNRRKNGSTYPEWLSITRITDAFGNPTHYIGVFSDLTSQRLGQARLEQLAHYDHLTELPNRLMFREQLKKAILRAHFNEMKVALLLFDIDRFKTINDSYGHQVGDQILQQIAKRLRSCLRAEGNIRNGDIVARISGDEFTIILNELKSADSAKKIACRVLNAFTAPFQLGLGSRQITVSIGIAMSPGDAENVDDLIRCADLAMYYAKRQGRNTYQIYAPSVQQDNRTRLTLENDLYGALQRGELFLHYQPQYDLQSLGIVGVEALLRWRHPQLGIVSPDQFIPLLEETGLIIPVGEWVLEQACQDCLAFRTDHGELIPVSVNLSSYQFRRDIVDTVNQILSLTGLPPSKLKLELTESLAMKDVKTTIEVLEHFAGLGIEVHIDDFGTGYSSLSYLKQFRISVLKIDKSFISGEFQNVHNSTIVRAIIALAHSLNLRVIAEGIETPEQLQFLQSNQCEMGQGYWFSRPLPPEEIVRLLATVPIPRADRAPIEQLPY